MYIGASSLPSRNGIPFIPSSLHPFLPFLFHNLRYEDDNDIATSRGGPSGSAMASLVLYDVRCTVSCRACVTGIITNDERATWNMSGHWASFDHGISADKDDMPVKATWIPSFPRFCLPISIHWLFHAGLNGAELNLPASSWSWTRDQVSQVRPSNGDHGFLVMRNRRCLLLLRGYHRSLPTWVFLPIPENLSVSSRAFLFVCHDCLIYTVSELLYSMVIFSYFILVSAVPENRDGGLYLSLHPANSGCIQTSHIYFLTSHLHIPMQCFDQTAGCCILSDCPGNLDRP